MAASRAGLALSAANEELKSVIKSGDWNDMDIIARGNTLIQMINGRVMSILIDDDKAHRKLEGEIGIQLHRVPGTAMTIETRNIRIKSFLARAATFALSVNAND